MTRPQILGLALAGAGLALRVWAMLHLRRAGIQGQALAIMTRPRFRIQSGPYRFLSHPMYLGTVILFSGVGMLALGWGGVVLSLPVMPWIMERAASESELLRRMQ